VSERQLAELPRYAQSEAFAAVEKLALDLAVAMTLSPAEVSDELRTALRRHLTPAQLTELVAAIAWENHRARLNRALGVRAAGFSDGAACAMPERPPALP